MDFRYILRAFLLICCLTLSSGCGKTALSAKDRQAIRSTAYPPTSLRDARLLAETATDDLRVAQVERVSFPPCECRLHVLVPPGLGKRAQAAALLRSFFDHRLDRRLDDYDGDGAVAVLGWARRGDVGRETSTAGRVVLERVGGQHILTINDGTDEDTLSY